MMVQAPLRDAPKLLRIICFETVLLSACLNVNGSPLGINYKILIFTYKALHNLGPTYLSDLLLPYVRAPSLGSSSEGLLVTPEFRLVIMGSRAFSVVAPRL